MSNNFIQNIQGYINQNETGRLEIRNLKKQNQSWSFYFTLGRLIGAGSTPPNQRRIYRQFKKHAPEIVKQPLQLKRELNWNSPSFEYDLACHAFQENKINVKQLVAIHNEIIAEILFDLLQLVDWQSKEGSQYGDNSGLQWEWFAKVRPEKYTPIPQNEDFSSEQLLKHSFQQWQKWQKAGLQKCLPNQAPIILDAESIQEATATKTFENLKRLLTGKQTLRDIAIDTRRDLLQVTQALWGYYQKGWLRFQYVPDLQLNRWVKTASVSPSKPVASSQNKQNKFVVACVDDSPQITQTIEKILHENGYDCISINDPLRASARLLKEKPDLIFLDLIMPNTNGYEICTQLRRVSSLQEIPIIILTGKDGLIDRMRAKMAGSTQYVSKPVETNKILDVVQKYLPHNTGANSTETTTSFSSAEA